MPSPGWTGRLSIFETLPALARPVHELRRDGKTLCYLMFPIGRLKELARKAYSEGRFHEGGGDGGRFCNILIPLREILR